MATKKSFVLAPYQSSPSHPVDTAMYETTDDRLVGNQIIGGGGKVILGTIVPSHQGTFTRTKLVKGLYNGGEIGYFVTSDKQMFLIFSDYSTNPMSKEIAASLGL